MAVIISNEQTMVLMFSCKVDRVSIDDKFYLIMTYQLPLILTALLHVA